MPAKDLYHDVVVEALTADGWTITDDPLYLSSGKRVLYLAVPKSAYSGIFSEELGQLMIERLRLRLIVFEVKTERIIKWIS